MTIIALGAEDRVLGWPNWLVVRMPLLVGAGLSFEASGFLSQIVRALRNPAPQEADAVLRRFPTWIRDVAEAIAFLVNRGETGVAHISGEEWFTRHEMITQAAEVMGFAADHIAPSARVVPRRAVRPRDSQLAADRIRAMGFRRFTPFREVVLSFAATFPEETRSPDVNARRRDTRRERRPGGGTDWMSTSSPMLSGSDGSDRHPSEPGGRRLAVGCARTRLDIL